MSDIKSCELCGSNTSGTKNERLEEYQERLIAAATTARDERSLVFIAIDELNKLDSISSGARALPHEKHDNYKVHGARYCYAEKSKERMLKAIKCLQLAVSSIDEHLELRANNENN